MESRNEKCGYAVLSDHGNSRGPGHTLESNCQVLDRLDEWPPSFQGISRRATKNLDREAVGAKE